MDNSLEAFLQQSNLIEGIDRAVSSGELEAAREFLNTRVVTQGGLQSLVDAFEPGAKLRSEWGMDVRVGRHVPPRGGPGVVARLLDILEDINDDKEPPFYLHLDYETLHPFTDGNGRSGRALWLWQTLNRGSKSLSPLPLGFLHHWYYQTLEHWGRL